MASAAAREVRAADRELRGRRLSAGRARSAWVTATREPVEAMSFEALAEDVESAIARARSNGPCWSATRWAAWWCRRCCAAGRTTIAPPCSPAPRPRSAIRPAISRRSSWRIASRRSMPASTMADAAPGAADGIMGPNADPAGRALFIEEYRGGAGADISRRGEMPRHLRRARQPAAHQRAGAVPRRRARPQRAGAGRGEDGGEDSRRAITSAWPAAATCRTWRRRRPSTPRSSISSIMRSPRRPDRLAA